jgi:hypothetical protein
MEIYPNNYNKETFLRFLKRNNVSNVILNEFNDLPEIVKKRTDEFKLDVNVT